MALCKSQGRHAWFVAQRGASTAEQICIWRGHRWTSRSRPCWWMAPAAARRSRPPWPTGRQAAWRRAAASCTTLLEMAPRRLGVCFLECCTGCFELSSWTQQGCSRCEARWPVSTGTSFGQVRTIVRLQHRGGIPRTVKSSSDTSLGHSGAEIDLHHDEHVVMYAHVSMPTGAAYRSS